MSKPAAPDYTRTCEGCPDVKKEAGVGFVMLLCGAKGNWQHAPVCRMKGRGAGMYLPFIPAWCPRMK